MGGMAATGRPKGSGSLYTPELAGQLCELMVIPMSTLKACQQLGIANSTIFHWIKDVPAFAENYARAREIQCDALAAETVDISDDLSEDPNSRRIRIDARKWYASKVAPKKYGDKLELAGDPAAPLTFTVRRIAGKE